MYRVRLQDKKAGFGLVEVVVSLGIITLAISGLMSFYSRSSDFQAATRHRADLEMIRRTILNRISCARSLKAAPCTSYFPIIDIKGLPLISSSGTRFADWTVVGRCNSGLIKVEASKLKQGRPVSSNAPEDFNKDTILGGAMNWTTGTELLFPGATSPCEFARTYSRHPLKRGETLFDRPGNFIYTAPPDVTRILVEIWGAGGGGAGGTNTRRGHGGGGGGFAKVILDVAPGSLHNIAVGAGGANGGCNASGAPGGDSAFDNVIAYAGGGATAAAPGAGGNYLIPAPITGHGQVGGRGFMAYAEQLLYLGAPLTLSYLGMGHGGNSPNGGSGDIYSATAPPGGVAPGGGGRGGIEVPIGACGGTPGAPGRVVIGSP